MRRLAVFLSVGLLLGSCGANHQTDERPSRHLTIHSSPEPTHLVVEIADTPQARQQGLMGRTSLDPDAGMAFLFDAPTRDAFWMKNTLIPLSIAFWDRQGRIVAVLDMEPCTVDPCPTYRPDVPYVGAVEVNLGFFQDHGVKVGDVVELGSVDSVSAT
ncbi:MAG: DUF192 domain-containing protein [Actinomycetota bacterium]